jgi:two-component system chemotaxis response regulator CheY
MEEIVTCGKLQNCLITFRYKPAKQACHQDVHSIQTFDEDKEAIMKTLIAEDDLVSRLLLQTFLSRYGTCHTVVTGTEAIGAFRLAADEKAPYDLVCMDIRMPELDGKDAVSALRAIEEERNILFSRGVKVIMTTGSSDTKQIFKSFQALCDDYLVKPIDTGRLLDHLRSYGLVS